MDEKDYKKIVESALFMVNFFLSPEQIKEQTGIESVGKIKEILEELKKEYDERDTAIRIVEVDGKYAFALKDPYVKYLKNLSVEPEISKGALRILAYISKNEGILQSSVVKAFGSASYQYIKELEEKEFISSKKAMRSKELRTTNKFKQYFSSES
ncbi:MAG: SMC-Scp complex subunit ScpB [Candidatus Micrarchaeaceae archaeon]